jgi:hypothetical protein
MPFTIKTVCCETLKIRRFYVDASITYDALVNAIVANCGCSDGGNVKLCICYVDCEGDFVGIANTDDLKVALDVFSEKQVLKLFIKGCSEEAECDKDKCCKDKSCKDKCCNSECCPDECCMGMNGCCVGKCCKAKCDKECSRISKAICCRKETVSN